LKLEKYQLPISSSKAYTPERPSALIMTSELPKMTSLFWLKEMMKPDVEFFSFSRVNKHPGGRNASK
jgi:hypothetical protein